MRPRRGCALQQPVHRWERGDDINIFHSACSSFLGGGAGSSFSLFLCYNLQLRGRETFARGPPYVSYVCVCCIFTGTWKRSCDLAASVTGLVLAVARPANRSPLSYITRRLGTDTQHLQPSSTCMPWRSTFVLHVCDWLVVNVCERVSGVMYFLFIFFLYLNTVFHEDFISV